MISRDTNLQTVLDLARNAILRSGDARALKAAARVYDRLEASQGPTVEAGGGRLPVCQHNLDAAFAAMAAEASPMPEIGSAFAAVEDHLRWTRRKSVTPADQPFYDGHANAMLIGPGGLEERDDVMVGASLVAPHTVYPDHNHPPEEVYVVLTGGEWWNTAMEWTRPGPAGIVYNPPGIMHAMRAGDTPLLALWFLPLG